MLPKGAKLLKVHEQRDEVYGWFLVDTDQPLESRSFVAWMTGEGRDHVLQKFKLVSNVRLEYVDTVFMEGGAMVFHIFEVMPPSEETGDLDRLADDLCTYMMFKFGAVAVEERNAMFTRHTGLPFPDRGGRSLDDWTDRMDDLALKWIEIAANRMTGR